MERLGDRRVVSVIGCRMYLREIQVVADADAAVGLVEGTVATFNRQVLCITGAFNLLLKKKLEISGFPKVFARLTSAHVAAQKSRGVFLPMSVWHAFDFRLYADSDNIMKKRILLETIQAILRSAAAHFNWKLEVIDDAANQIRDAQFSISVMSAKKWRHPNKSLSMQVECQFELDEFALTAVLSRVRNGEIARSRLGSAPPIPDYVQRYQSDAEWVSPELFELRVKHSFGTEVWRWQIKPELVR